MSRRFVQDASRRLFLKQAGAFSALGAGAPLAMSLAAAGSASAADAADYKALVCVFLGGGNDAFNTVLATDEPSWSAYAAVRQQQPESIALLRGVAANKTQAPGSPAWLGGVLPLSLASGAHPGRALALHPMLPGLQTLFNTNKRLAVVANVGPLVEQLGKADYAGGTGRKPSKLFSHNDQQSTWQSLAPEGATAGWGGQLADVLAGGNGQSMFTAVSVDGASMWAAGRATRSYQVSSTGPIRLGTQPDSRGISRVYGSDAIGMALERIATTSRGGHLMAADLADVASRSLGAERTLSAALPAVDSPFGPSGLLQYDRVVGGRALNPLAQQLQTVARMIAAQKTLGMKRQVFFVSLNGFDTHNAQNRNHAELLAKLNHGLSYFDAVLAALGLGEQVTTFTASDFGRSFTSNGDGTDHGWGGHHFVMGGAVQGGAVHGDFPVLARKNAGNNEFDGSPDQLLNGVLLPRISVDQYGATLGRWFGVGASQLSEIFPNLAKFRDKTDLGFMRT